MNGTGGQAITRTDCLRLVRAGGLGRIVFTASAMPAVQPVGFELDGDEVIFRVPFDGPVALAIRDAVVGFQVDDIDPLTGTGWTVLGVGRACGVAGSDSADDRAATFVVALQEVAGRRVQLVGAFRDTVGDGPAVPFLPARSVLGP